MAKPSTTTHQADLDIETSDRFDLVKEAGYQVTAIAQLMRQPIYLMRHAGSRAEEVALSLYLDRLDTLGTAIADLGCPQDDADGNQDQLAELLILSVEIAPQGVSE